MTMYNIIQKSDGKVVGSFQAETATEAWQGYRGTFFPEKMPRMIDFRVERASTQTPIELVAESLNAQDEFEVTDVLVPEQCCMVWIGDKPYSLIMESIDEEDGT